MKLLVLALIASMILVLPITHAYGRPYYETDVAKHETYKVYTLMVHVKINGHPIKMILDTGDQISDISGPAAKHMGLNKLHPSHGILSKTETLGGVYGHPETEKTADVKMSIEGSHPFKTALTYSTKSNNIGDPLLSLHDFMKAFSGMDVKPTLQFVH